MKRLRLGAIAGALLLLGCGAAGDKGDGRDPALEGLALVSVQPEVIVPGTAMLIEGRSFVEEPWGISHLQLDGTYTFEGGSEPVDALLVPSRFVDFDHLTVDVDGELFAALGADEGTFTGTARVVVDSGVDDGRYRSEPLEVTLEFRSALVPMATELTVPSLVFVNSQISVTGSGLLLGGNEGETIATIEGLFEDEEGVLEEIGPLDVPVESTAYSRNSGVLVLPPELAGVNAGTFVGTVALSNDHLAGERVPGATQLDLDFDLLETTLFAVSPSSVSLGQYMNLHGGGFLDQMRTTVRLSGTFTAVGSSEPMPLGELIEVVPEFVDGGTLRYVVNDEDLPIDLRTQTGVFEGELIPIIDYEGIELEGSSVPFEIQIAAVKQVVYLKFTNNFVEALRNFGLRGAEQRIRDRVVAVVERDYATINLEVRTEAPEDFALYAEVEIGGQDPQGLGLLGYDNTPGKDVGNMRLYDRLGGVNAQTQHDGYPGYGGVFVDSLFAFSKHPIPGIQSVPASDRLFDEVFDPFRPDRGGRPVRAVDLQGGIELDVDTSQCPAATREQQLACATVVLGNLIGTTLSHEIGHSLGLANPYGASFHNPFDEPNRLMDGGGSRPFTERAQLMGDGPGLFCDEEYDYLREILPTNAAADPQDRPTCF